MMKVIVIDDDKLVEMSLTTILQSDSEIEVAGSGHDGTEAVELYKKEHPDIVLMDIQMLAKAVNNINFSVEEGEMLAFIGPNGAGKSTTIKMLTGILYPTSG